MARFVPGRSMPNIAKLRQTSMPSDASTSDAGGYTPPPTERDLAQSAVHHADSSAFNLRHAKTHNESTMRALDRGDVESARYNAGHAQGHLDDGLGHAQATIDRMSDSPRFQPHVQALGGRMNESRDSGGGNVMGDDGAGASVEGPPAPDRTFRKAFGRTGGTPRFGGRR